MTAALFAREAPLAAENFRQLCVGDGTRGVVPLGREGAGRPYSLRGASFYRNAAGFLIQSGTYTESIYGGHFSDDPGGLALPHDREGLLSVANLGQRGTNGGHFTILLAPAPHLDGKYVVFGELVDAQSLEVARAVNALADPANEKQPRGNATIAFCGELAPDAADA